LEFFNVPPPLFSKGDRREMSTMPDSARAAITAEFEAVTKSEESRRTVAPSFFGAAISAKQVLVQQITSFFAAAIVRSVLTAYSNDLVILIIAIEITLILMTILPVVVWATMRHSDNPWFVFLFDTIQFTAIYFDGIYAVSMLELFWNSGTATVFQKVVIALGILMLAIVVIAEIEQRFARTQFYTRETVIKLEYWLACEPDRRMLRDFKTLYDNKVK
jgi:hypothetical protein